LSQAIGCSALRSGIRNKRMKRIHPNVGHGAAAALALLLGVTGCRSHEGGIPNPFLAPNRVPPPATRAILPGQAQPYYPGDPLPVMQSGTPHSMGAIATTAPAQQIPSADTALTWGSPTKQPDLTSAPPARVVAAVNEPRIAIPNDASALRFDLPATTQSAQTIASTPTPGNTVPPTSSSRVPTPSYVNQGVVQASYTQPVANPSKPNTTDSPAYSITQAPTGPWRSPQIPGPTTLAASSNSPWAPALQQMPVPPPPSWVPNPTPYGQYVNTQNVQLRAVASPPAVGEPVPRIRFPGYTATAQNESAAMDGFRPRSSMR
jgi:hypothetical protein